MSCSHVHIVRGDASHHFSNTHRMNDSSQDERYERFVGLLSRYEPSIRSYVHTLLPGGQGIDDVCQETALECWRKFADFDDQGDEASFIRWACVIAHFKVLSWVRDHSRDRLVFRESILQTIADRAIEDSDQKATKLNAMERCLKSMDQENRQLLLSIYSPGKSVVEISQETGQAVGRLYRRIRGLRKSLLDCIRYRIAEGC